MKNWLNLNENTPWIKGYEDTNSNPVYKHAESPENWKVKCTLRTHILLFNKDTPKRRTDVRVPCRERHHRRHH